MTESNSANVIELPEKPDVNWLLCYLFEATCRLDRTLALYKHWREIAKADPGCALDDVLAPPRTGIVYRPLVQFPGSTIELECRMRRSESDRW